MLETIFAFSIFCMIASFIPLLYQTMLSNYSTESRFQKMEWEVFLNQLKHEVQSSEQIISFEKKLLIIKDGKQILFEPYGGHIRRKVDDKGHEIVLQNMNYVHYEYVESVLTITVKNLQNHTYTAKIHPIIESETNE